MSERRHLTLVAAGATLLGSLPLATVFQGWTWFFDATIVVGLMLAVAVTVRSFPVPSGVATGAMFATFVLLLGWLFPSRKEELGVIPTIETLENFNNLLVAAGYDMRTMGAPVEDRPGLLFLSTLGIGAMAILVDLFAVELRRPALAGLPMLAIYSVPVAVHQQSVHFLPFAAGAGGFLWLLVTDNVDRVRRFGRRFTGDGRDIDVRDPSPLAAAGRRLAAVGVLLAVLLPPMVPGMTTGLLQHFGVQGAGNGLGPPGRGPSVDLYAALTGDLTRDREYPMVRVQTNDPAPYYLRFAVAEDLQPNGFRGRGTGSGQPVTGKLPGPAAPEGTGGVNRHAHRAAVEIVDFDMRLLPVYLTPVKTERLDNAWLYEPTQQVVYSNQATSKKLKYTFDFVRTEFTPDALRTAPPLSPGSPIQRLFTDVPRVNDVNTLVAKLTAGKGTQYDKVRAIHDYFSAENKFTYSLRTRPGTSGSDIVDFLTNKEGYCVQYSAAMAWLVRAAGIPARVAFGFTRGNKREGNTYTLTNLNLHAWTEVYFNGFGWVSFDPTPQASVPGSVSQSWAPDPNQSATGPDGSQDPSTPATDPSANPAAAGNPNNRFPDEDPNFGSSPIDPPAPSRWPLWTLTGITVVLAALAAPALRRAWLRRRRWPARALVAGTTESAVNIPPGQPRVLVPDETATRLARERAHAAWDELIDTMIDYRIRVDEAETPRVTAERLAGSPTAAIPSVGSASTIAAGSMIGNSPTIAAGSTVAGAADSTVAGAAATDGVRLLGRAEECARYARQPLDTEDLGISLAHLRAALASRASWRVRLIAALLPPSVVQSWRAAFVLGVTNALDTVARRRDAIARMVNPRRRPAGRFSRRAAVRSRSAPASWW